MIQINTGWIKISILNENLLSVLICLGAGFYSSFAVSIAVGFALEIGLVTAQMALHLQLQARWMLFLLKYLSFWLKQPLNKHI